ncbi:MAG: nickel pincer cofactor biosynthesis protein LarC [Planctomycetota bacterium]|nr:nickel pincer cofactor biosynthesis protein LarC [Planctomycetota bacterium]
MSKSCLYIDSFSGISGDMFIGALLELGLDFEHLKAELSKLKLEGYELKRAPVLRGVVAATKFDVLVHHDPAAHSHAQHHEHGHGHAHDHAHRHGHSHDHEHEPGEEPQPRNSQPHVHRPFKAIRKLIEESALSPRVKEGSLRAFTLLAEVEARMHGQAVDEVQFHEVGGIDSIVDFAGAMIGLEALGIDEVRCGPLALGGDGPQGGGYVSCAHGKLPVPAFATLELAKGLPLRRAGVDKELTTPTGAALVKALVKPEHFGPLPAMNVLKIGYGAGTRNDPAIPIPNVLRAVLGTPASVAAGSCEADTVVELQANLDDATGEVMGYAAERLFALGALDVFFTPIQMKKSRPGALLTALVPPEKQDAALELLFRETPTFGVRYETKRRAKLARETRTVTTPWGPVRVKVGTWRGETLSAHPEYEDCKRLAEAHGVPLREVIDTAKVLFTAENAKGAEKE